MIGSDARPHTDECSKTLVPPAETRGTRFQHLNPLIWVRLPVAHIAAAATPAQNPVLVEEVPIS